MGRDSTIEWTDDTWNPVRGCTRISEGCRHCYAEQVASRFSGPGQPYEGFADRARPGSKWTGKVDLVERAINLPFQWRKPRRIFVNSMSDLFHESLLYATIDRVFAVMAVSPQHTFMVLTKRAGIMRDYLGLRSGNWKTKLFEANPPGSLRVTKNDVGRALGLYPKFSYDPPTPTWPLPNVWLGVSVENQDAANVRIPHLLATPAAVRFLSCEPMVGPVDLNALAEGQENLNALSGLREDPFGDFVTRRVGTRVDWVICGGESGPGARPMNPDWARSLRDQCAGADVPFFMKQMGGAVKAQMPPIPADLTVREFPDD